MLSGEEVCLGGLRTREPGRRGEFILEGEKDGTRLRLGPLAEETREDKRPNNRSCLHTKDESTCSSGLGHGRGERVVIVCSSGAGSAGD